MNATNSSEVIANISQVADAFLTPKPPKERLPLSLPHGETLLLSTQEGRVRILRAGEGPAVLLLHGWEGQASDMAAFAPPLLTAGFTVLAMELPAHGGSSGTQASIPDLARALQAVADALGPLHAVIAHSMGGAVLAEALHDGMQAQRVVLIAAPARYERYARAFGAAAGLDADGIEAMLAELRDARGVDVRSISLPARAPALHQPALFIHSGDDRVVPIEDSLASASAWPGAGHRRVEGLGHRRLLRDQQVVEEAVRFATLGRA
ncbi:alpha/beta fold hydrolase [Noviherbaspirillum pedocola]|uniref:Alpha/beta fold hydrolase n=1 Tax=Noviherbaspirillum pedocola TaxID=2801341 RepID=A0A934SX48_9BURK|nr:alpha/beta fold hydrolase [Noviherbaspirillum pedocola]MBK4736671.1 alpha/beta fold hydrolase [Noviherbaspirillum pedocola]